MSLSFSYVFIHLVCLYPYLMFLFLSFVFILLLYLMAPPFNVLNDGLAIEEGLGLIFLLGLGPT